MLVPIVSAISVVLALPPAKLVPPGCAVCLADIAADLDGDGAKDRTVVYTAVQGTEMVVRITLATGEELTPLRADYRPGDQLSLEYRDSGDPRCRDWKPGITCAKYTPMPVLPMVALKHSRHGDYVFSVSREGTIAPARITTMVAISGKHRTIP